MDEYLLLGIQEPGITRGAGKGLTIPGFGHCGPGKPETGAHARIPSNCAGNRWDIIIFITVQASDVPFVSFIVAHRLAQDVLSASGPQSVKPLGVQRVRAEIGLRDAESIASIEVFWPATGRSQRLEGLSRDREYRVREDASAAVEVVRRLGDQGHPPRTLH